MPYAVTPLFSALLILLVAIPVLYSDYVHHRIPNTLVIAGICGGFALQISSHGAVGALLAAIGLVIGILCLLPFHIVGATGAGDVKLMGAMGAILGPFIIFIAFLLTLIVGSLLGIAAVAGPRLAATVGHDQKTRIPYGAAICTGALAAPWVAGGLDALIPLRIFSG